MERVCTMLDELGLAQYKKIFLQNKVCIAVFFLFTSFAEELLGIYACSCISHSKPGYIACCRNALVEARTFIMASGSPVPIWAVPIPQAAQLCGKFLENLTDLALSEAGVASALARSKILGRICDGPDTIVPDSAAYVLDGVAEPGPATAEPCCGLM